MITVTPLPRTRFATNSHGVTTDTHAAAFEARFVVSSNGTTTDRK